MAYSGKFPLNKREPASKEMPVVARPLEAARGPQSGKSTHGMRFDGLTSNKAFHATDTKMGDEPTAATGSLIDPAKV